MQLSDNREKYTTLGILENQTLYTISMQLQLNIYLVYSPKVTYVVWNNHYFD